MFRIVELHIDDSIVTGQQLVNYWQIQPDRIRLIGNEVDFFSMAQYARGKKICVRDTQYFPSQEPDELQFEVMKLAVITFYGAKQKDHLNFDIAIFISKRRLKDRDYIKLLAVAFA